MMRRISWPCWVVAVLLLASSQSRALAGGVLHVDASAAEGGDGSSWNSALRYLQDALSIAANDASGVSEIRVAQGTYRPDRTSLAPQGTGDRNARFAMISGVALRGGYAGLAAGSGEDPDTRDIQKYQTILTGDLADNDLPPPPPGVTVTPAHFLNSIENAYQVVVAINVNAAATLDGFTITGGYADGPGFGAVPESQEQGSGLNVYFASPTIINCTFLQNWNLNHGAVNDHGDATTLINCTFRANYAAGFGAGLYTHHHSITTAVNCRFLDNFTPGEGAGSYSRSMMGAMYEACEYVGNLAQNKGGGAYNALGSMNMFMNCTFTNNAAFHGGGMYADLSDPAIMHCTFEGNLSQSHGGGLYCFGGQLTADMCTFHGNHSGGGGGGAWNEEADVLITHCSFTANSADMGGAGLYNLRGNELSVSDCTFTGNISQDTGGGLWNGLNSPTVTNCTFVGNQAISGGGLYNTDFSVVTVDNCTFIDNHSGEGGGIYNFQSNSIIRNCLVRGNSATNGAFSVGGGIVNYFCSPHIHNCRVELNVAELGGGGIYSEGESPTISNCVITRNACTGIDDAWGGGILNAYFTSATFINCEVTGNVARQGGGVANLTIANPSLINCTIIGNRATDIDGGGGIYNAEGSDPAIMNSIVWHNSPHTIGGFDISASYSCIEDVLAGPGNMHVQPDFVDEPNVGPDMIWATDDDAYGDLRLAPGSAGIDAGDNAVVPSNVTVDLAGTDRFIDDPATPDTGHPAGRKAVIDMGAYEYGPVFCPADIAPPGGDGAVNVSDLLAVINAWGLCNATCPADINGDQIVNVSDLLAVINNWGACK